MHEVGKKIRELRRRKGWSQDDAAGRLRISVPAYSKIETGITDPSLSRLEQIARLYDVRLTELLGSGSGEPQETPRDRLEKLRDTISQREQDIVLLQNKLIELYQELRQVGLLGRP